MDVISEIHQQYSTLSSKEQSIANYILRYGQSLQNMNISVLAEKAGVSPGTVTRFCRKVACASFVELKLRLNRELSRDTGSNSFDVPNEVYNFYKSVIECSNNMINRELLAELVREIRNQPLLHIYGVGNSGLSANELMLRLSRMGLAAQAITDSHMMMINSSLMSSGNLIIAISVSGETTDIVNAVRVAHNNGCRIISLCSSPNSSLALLSDLFIPIANSNLICADGFMNSQFSVLYVIDLICSVLLREESLRSKMNITINTIIEQSHINHK